MQIEEVKKYLSQNYLVSDYNNCLLINNNFYCYIYEEDDMPICLKEHNGTIILTDMAKTYNRLIKNGIDIEEDEFFEYVKNVLVNMIVGFDRNTKEFYVKITQLEEINEAMSRLLQVLILINNIELQFED